MSHPLSTLDIIEEAFCIVSDTLQNMKRMTVLMRKLKRDDAKQKKAVSNKKKKKKNTNDGNEEDLTIDERQNNGLIIPEGFCSETKVSDEMCKFLGLENGTVATRHDITKRFYNVMKSCRLICNDDHCLKLTPSLKNLLSINHPSVDHIDLAHVQKKINRHFLGEKKIEAPYGTCAPQTHHNQV